MEVRFEPLSNSPKGIEMLFYSFIKEVGVEGQIALDQFLILYGDGINHNAVLTRLAKDILSRESNFYQILEHSFNENWINFLAINEEPQEPISLELDEIQGDHIVFDVRQESVDLNSRELGVAPVKDTMFYHNHPDLNCPLILIRVLEIRNCDQIYSFSETNLSQNFILTLNSALCNIN